MSGRVMRSNACPARRVQVSRTLRKRDISPPIPPKGIVDLPGDVTQVVPVGQVHSIHNQASPSLL
jgi:hypothetical protein